MSLTPIKWTNEQIFQLIEMYKNRKLLWNTMLEEYRDRKKKHEAWMEIANTFGMDRHDVERKVKSLVGQFQRELKKISCLENGTDEMSKWFAYKKMMFLRVRSESEHTRGAGMQVDGENKKEMETETEKGQNTFATPKNRSHLKRALPQEDEPSEASSILEKRYRSRQTRDEFDVFGEHVAMKLRNLDSSFAKHTAQFEINKILYKAAIGHYNRPSSNSPQYITPSNSGFHIPGRSGLSESSATPDHSSVLSMDDSSQSLDDMLNTEDIKPDIKELTSAL